MVISRNGAISFRKHGGSVCLRVSAGELLDDDGKKILKAPSVTLLIHRTVKRFFEAFKLIFVYASPTATKGSICEREGTVSTLG